MTKATLPLAHPGKILAEEFLRPLGFSQARLGERLFQEVRALEE